jgi:hypothetical protein
VRALLGRPVSAAGRGRHEQRIGNLLAEKAASWGDMPLHVWLRAVIKDPAAIAGVEELLGASADGL